METFNFFVKVDNYDFNYYFGYAFDIKEGEEAYFKMVNFSMMNSMLNVSSYHNNNKFKINDTGVITTYTIPDGNYSVATLRDKINELTASTPIAFNYDASLNKYYIDCVDTGVVFYPLNMKMLLGFEKESYNLIIGQTYGSKFANMLSYTKLLLVSNSLVFNPTTDNNLIQDYSAKDGINEIICWMDKDIPTFVTIKYENFNGDEFKIANKNLTYINFTLMNEFKEVIRDAPEYYIQFQIKIKPSSIVDN